MSYVSIKTNVTTNMNSNMEVDIINFDNIFSDTKEKLHLLNLKLNMIKILNNEYTRNLFLSCMEKFIGLIQDKNYMDLYSYIKSFYKNKNGVNNNNIDDYHFSCFYGNIIDSVNLPEKQKIIKIFDMIVNECKDII